MSAAVQDALSGFAVSLEGGQLPILHGTGRIMFDDTNRRMAQWLRFEFTDGTLIRENRIIIDAHKNGKELDARLFA